MRLSIRSRNGSHYPSKSRFPVTPGTRNLDEVPSRSETKRTGDLVELKVFTSSLPVWILVGPSLHSHPTHVRRVDNFLFDFCTTSKVILLYKRYLRKVSTPTNSIVCQVTVITFRVSRLSTLDGYL